MNFDVKEGKLVMHKPAFGGNVISLITTKTKPQMATARPGMFKPLVPNPGRRGEVTRVVMHAGGRISILARRPVDIGLPDLEGAEVVIGVGRGLKRRENVELAIALAKKLGAAVAATRNVVLAGWLPYKVQVGVSGRAIAPKLYIAFGVSGHINHLVGIRNARYIVAVNVNRHADIFKVADLGVVGDALQIIPILLERAVVPRC